MPWARVVIGLIVGLAPLFFACDEPTAPEHLGVARAGTGVEVVYVPCPGSYVERVRVISPTGADPYDGDDAVIWEIRADGTNQIQEFEVGTAPPGYIEVTPLRGRESGELVVAVETSKGSAGMRFSVDELPRDDVLSDGRAVGRDVFIEGALDGCR